MWQVLCYCRVICVYFPTQHIWHEAIGHHSAKDTFFEGARIETEVSVDFNNRTIHPRRRSFQLQSGLIEKEPFDGGGITRPPMIQISEDLGIMER